MTATVQELNAEIARLREELEKKTLLLDIMFDQNPDGIAIADAHFNITANPVSEVIFGTTGSAGATAADWT